MRRRVYLVGLARPTQSSSYALLAILEWDHSHGFIKLHGEPALTEKTYFEVDGPDRLGDIAQQFSLLVNLEPKRYG